jgi:hypothetical protein
MFSPPQRKLQSQKVPHVSVGPPPDDPPVLDPPLLVPPLLAPPLLAPPLAPPLLAPPLLDPLRPPEEPPPAFVPPEPIGSHSPSLQISSSLQSESRSQSPLSSPPLSSLPPTSKQPATAKTTRHAFTKRKCRKKGGFIEEILIGARGRRGRQEPIFLAPCRDWVKTWPFLRAASQGRRPRRGHGRRIEVIRDGTFQRGSSECFRTIRSHRCALFTEFA